MADPQLPKMVLRPVADGAETAAPAPKLPAAVAKSWDLGMKALTAKQWPAAEVHLRDVTRAVPAFDLGWSGLGFAYQSQNKTSEARDAFQRAIGADPASLLSRIQLLRLEISLRLWEPASKTAEALIRMDTAHRYPESASLSRDRHLHVATISMRRMRV